MLAGLLFAIQDADDRPGSLAATLNFGGTTLIEYQARLLIGIGASQIIVVVARLTPEVLGAISRIGQRGVTVDTVRSAGEAAAKLHPLARVVMLADSLVTTEAALAGLDGEGRDALLVLPQGVTGEGLERIDSATVWGGAARFDAARLGEVASLPSDYDPQSALVRAAVQAGAVRMTIDPVHLGAGHGVERRAVALVARGREVLGAALAGERGWFDRWIVAPLARPLLMRMLDRGVATIALAAAAAGTALAGLVAIGAGHSAIGLGVTALAAIVATAGVHLARIRDEGPLDRGLAIGATATAALAILLLGNAQDLATGELIGRFAAVTLILLAALGARAALPASRAGWWGSPVAYLTFVALGTIAGFPMAALLATTLYAAATLVAAIEVLRRDA